MLVEETPAPLCPKGGILVATQYSLISVGTEKTSVTGAQGSLLDRARKHPQDLRQVLDFVKKDGLISTIKRVQNKLESYKTLGYSAAGIVIETDCDEFAVGDLVACAGAGWAVHAEIIAVPRNLAARMPEAVSAEEAAYTTLGAIALQGVRQADVRLGENVAVIGLGLLGQLTVQLLKASGCRVIGLDINENLFADAKLAGCDECLPSSKDYSKSIKAFSHGIGCDAVIITAGTSSNEPIELSLDIARKKGKVVVVGAVNMNLPRSPFYEKEIDIRISCSYGPGRYDPLYEEYGNDYPPAYVRWTENRNMQAFLDLIAQGKINVKRMTTHKFAINDAPNAYKMITGDSKEPFLGILLNYPNSLDVAHIKRIIEVDKNKKHKESSQLSIGFIGAGSFAQNHLLPPIKASGVDLEVVSTSTSANALSVAKIFGFAKSSTGIDDVVKDKNVNMIFCASRHDSHAEVVIKALELGKPVFVEKPLAVNFEQLEKINQIVQTTQGKVMVGFNRRFSASFKSIKKFFSERTDPMMISYRVNAGMIPKTHWLYAPDQGDGRIVGEACHFIDCMVYLTGALPVKVYAESISTDNKEVFSGDNVVVTIKFSDGSIGSLQYFALGDSSYPKEYCEVFCEGAIATMNNFETVELVRGGKTKKLTFDGKKGIAEEVAETIKAVRTGKPMPITFEEIFAVTEATFAINENLSSGKEIGLCRS